LKEIHGKIETRNFEEETRVYLRKFQKFHLEIEESGEEKLDPRWF